MSNLLARAGVVLAVAVLTATMAVASPHKKKAPAVKCSACDMVMVTKKDKSHPRAVKIKGKTYYCCAKCDMNKRAATKCSACGMELATKKDKDHPRAVKIKGKTYYCCAKCKM